LLAVAALLGVCGLVFAGFGIYRQFLPRQFTAAQRTRIEAWEVGARWRTTAKTRIFPARVHYALSGQQIDVPGSLQLTARRLEIARETSCARAAGVGRRAMAVLDRDGCQAVLRATYTDATSSLVLTVGVAVLRGQTGVMSAADYLAGSAVPSQGAQARRLLLRPVPVPGTPAASFGDRQRQLSWVVGSGSYLVMATAGYADGRPRVSVGDDSYTLMEMTSLARGIAVDIATPLGTPPRLPHCPGGPGC
jgi:hypothetical protein